jgi:hypothetical protein
VSFRHAVGITSAELTLVPSLSGADAGQIQPVDRTRRG